VPITYESIRVFISSPKDVAEERKLAEKAINSVSSTYKESLGLQLDPVMWEDFLPKTPKLPEQKIQDILEAEIPKCQVFILILGERYGSKEPGHGKSNTQREVEIAIEVLMREKKIMFLSYFRKLSPNNDKGRQRQDVESFRNFLQGKGIWYKDYADASEFRDLITHALYRTVLRYRLATNKHKSLQNFWLFGEPDRPTNPLLAIIYPSMERAFMGPSDDKDVWLNRLEPNVVFEDFKAIQKIDKTLRLIGFRNFKIFNTANIPGNVNFMNRFWICLPRNTPGLLQAKKYEHVSRFELVRNKNRPSSYLKWYAKPNAKKYIKIRSPLAKYLHEQRSKMDVTGDWRHEMEHIVGKDYAILARFKSESTEIAMTDRPLQDYFLAGLRGLGTWGAGWFLDRRCREFDKVKNYDNLQFLLEIEYRDGRIYAVRDVSEEPQTYFDNELKIKTIRDNINRY